MQFETFSTSEQVEGINSKMVYLLQPVICITDSQLIV